MAGKSPGSELMRNRDFPPRAFQILGGVLRNKEKSRLFKYISELFPTLLDVASVCTPCYMLLRVIRSCCATDI